MNNRFLKKAILFATAAMLIAVILLAQKKESSPLALRWLKVEQLAEKQLPESALKEVEQIIDQAEKEKNAAQLIKGMLYKMRFTLEQNPDKAPELIREFEEFTNKTTSATDKALLQSMTAELYANFYQNNEWKINRRTSIAGDLPDDMNEWTKNIFYTKITNLLSYSLSNHTVLQKTNAIVYKDILLPGKDSRLLQPTLFELLAWRKINILNSLQSISDVKNPISENTYFSDTQKFVALKAETNYDYSIENKIIETYQQILSFRLTNSNIPALLNAELERLSYVRERTTNPNSDSLYLNALNELHKRYSSNEFVTEVIAEKATYYIEKAKENEFNESANTSNRKDLKRIAYNICADGIKRFPAYKRINILHNIQALIKQKNVIIDYQKETPLQKALKVNMKNTNTSNLQLKVYRINATAPQHNAYFKNGKNYNTDYPNRTLIEIRTITLKSNPNFEETESSFEIKVNDYGIYDFILEEVGSKTANNKTKGTFIVTDLAFLMRSNKPKISDVYVLNRQTGHPQQNVIVKVLTTNWNGNGYNDVFKGQYNTNNNGLINFSFENNYYSHILYFEKGKDSYFSSNSTPYYYNSRTSESQDRQVSFFTDRSLYRPGQILHFKAIAYNLNKSQQNVLPNSEIKIELINVNGKTVSTKLFKTNELGSISGEFALPQDGLNGSYSLRTQGGSLNFWVEEYKRPTFEVKIEKPKDEIRFGEMVKIDGSVKAYAGYNVADAEVKYRVVRTVHHFCWWYTEPQQEVATGTTKTDAVGNLSFTFIPKKEASKPSRWNDRVFNYTVYCDVTDTKGETQQGEQMLSIGDKSLFIRSNFPDLVEKNETLTTELTTETLNNELVNSTVSYSIYSVIAGNNYDENNDTDKDLKTDKEVLKGTFETKNKTLQLNFKNYASGRYKLIFTTKDSRNQTVSFEKTCIIYDKNEKKPPVKTYVWLQAEKTECAIGENAIIQFGTSTANTKVLYEIMQGNTILESRWIDLSNEIMNFEIPFRESYGTGVCLQFTFMKDEQLFSRKVQLTPKTIKKTITPSFSVFRNKLLPGEKAEWTVTIPKTVKDKTAAELLISMYDASLDAIRPHSWYFNPVYNETVAFSPTWTANRFDKEHGNIYFDVATKKVTDWAFDELYWFGLDLNSANYQYRPQLRRAARLTNSINVVEDNVSFSMAMEDVSQSTDNVSKNALLQKGVNQSKPLQIRTNFNETAFFYPQLCTDAQGNVKFSFTAPESLTRWNVNMLAHTADLYVGQKQEQVVTQKDLMVQMNLPRFVRRSDKLTLSANIVNLTDKNLSANVVFELIDPATEKVFFNQSKAVVVTSSSSPSPQVEVFRERSNGDEIVSFDIPALANTELVICKMVATAGNFSDGEQKYLPVLPDKVLVTESMPLIIRSNETRKFNFESMIQHAANVETKNLTVEFSSNPTWYAVQALPTLSTPENDNAIDYLTAYYANTLASYIANSNPKIAQVFDQWKKATGSRDALISNLQKNVELKNMLLEETPWVMAAQDETEQKRRIALLFDLNMQKNQSQQYMDKLLKLQGPNGGFSWFEGMHESRYITQEIVLNLARLDRLTKTANSKQQTINAALKYLDLEIARDFAELKRNNIDYLKQNCIGNMQLFYLHLRSEYPNIAIDKLATEAVQYYTEQSEKYWTSFTLYGKAMMAIVAHRNGKTTIANDILKSLKENALKTDELGMYWARNTSGYYWSERPIAVQAAIIEAFALVDSSNISDVDEMKIWLLKQKQTQRWDSPSATVNAIYALLMQGTDWLGNSSQVKIKLDGKTLEPSSTEVGTGYFKETIPVANIKPEMGQVTITNTDKVTQNHPTNKSSIGWGAMYWQYYQDLNKVEAQGGALKISKKLFVKSSSIDRVTLSHPINNGSTSMIPIEQTQLKKGDKVITRLVITTDRNLEFVALKDLRAACLEPVDQRSGYEWREGTGYYQTTKDASTQFFFSFLPKGTYVFEYEQWVNNSGTFTSGIASVQCQYAPEFVSHTGGEQFIVK